MRSVLLAVLCLILGITLGYESNSWIRVNRTSLSQEQLTWKVPNTSYRDTTSSVIVGLQKDEDEGFRTRERETKYHARMLPPETGGCIIYEQTRFWSGNNPNEAEAIADCYVNNNGWILQIVPLTTSDLRPTASGH